MRKIFPKWLHSLFQSLTETFSLPPRFLDHATEEAFIKDFGQRFAPFRRAAGVIGFSIWTSFFWWDFYNYSNHSNIFSKNILSQVLLLRLFGVLALFIMVLLSLNKRFTDDRFAHIVLLFGVLISSLTLIFMVVLVPPPLDYVYYFVGLYLILNFQFGFLHLRAKPVLLSTVLIVVCILLIQNELLGPFTLLTAVHFNPATFYFISTCFIGFGICVKFERYARQQYAHEQALENEQAANMLKVEALLQSKEKQRLMATEASHNKSKFLASAAHDLRQPMFGLSLSLEALRHAMRTGDSIESERLLLLSQRSARVMANSFNAVLDLSKLESGFVSPQLSNFDVIELVEEVSLSLSEYALSKQSNLRIRVPRGVRVMVYSDRLWLGLVMKNLLSNAIKYGNPTNGNKSFVLISIVRLRTRVRFDVVDNGIGIPESQWKIIFEPFVQLNNLERDREKGLGLGLSIVNAIISILDQHALEFKSKPGKGTRFSIEIPKGVDDGSIQVSAEQSLVDVSLVGTYVILVEDDILVRTAMEAMFTHWGMLVDVAENLNALSLLLKDLERYPDLIITDYRLANDATAVEVVNMIKSYLVANSSARSIPVLLVTGEANSTGLKEIVGAAAVLTKPTQPQEMKTVIRGLLSNSERYQVD